MARWLPLQCYMSMWCLEFVCSALSLLCSTAASSRTAWFQTTGLSECPLSDVGGGVKVEEREEVTIPGFADSVYIGNIALDPETKVDDRIRRSKSHPRTVRCCTS
mmetsp:Transcript_20999/g.52594  ORF Transcript_20999/g.52594 Transcript_20999/m.52594 type:complete len:105 (+) Transcript_20999:2091-2405(+)